MSCCNSYQKTHPLLKQYTEWPFIHAEAACLIAVGKALSAGCDIYVYRTDKSGNAAMAKPCEHICQPVMKAYGIRHAYYTIAPNEFGMIDVQAT